MAEARLKEQKEKESAPVLSSGIWSGQNLTWANSNSGTSQWSNNGNIMFSSLSMWLNRLNRILFHYKFNYNDIRKNVANK